MKKIFLLSFLLFLFSLPLSSLSINDFNFYLEPQLGTTFGKIGEYLHTGMSDTSRVISYLEWEEKPLVVLKLKGGTEFNNIDLSGFVSYALPFQCGQMTDSDWYVADTKNNYGIFDNKLSTNIDLGIEASYKFNLPLGFTIKTIASFEYKYISFNGINGQGWYGSSRYSKNHENVSWDSEDATFHHLSGIDYYQHSFMTYLGLGAGYNWNKLTIKLNILISPYAYFFYVDYHNDYKDNGDDYSTISMEHGLFKLFLIDFTTEYKLFPKLFLTISISEKVMPEITGQTGNCNGNFITQKKYDRRAVKSPQTTGTSVSEINSSIGFKILF
ncbi:MAG: omptin family outer membrane protease [Treponema sp.]|nr:omptin family outer membrane protease [Treponema sp.]